MAGKFAAALNAKNLIITHFSARYDDLNPLRVETEQVCPDTNVCLNLQRL
jgi:ribonuclease BN (tRNA processing enzyme)